MILQEKSANIRIPFLMGRVVYLPGEDGNRLSPYQVEDMKAMFSDKDFRFLDLDGLLSRLSLDACRYSFPGWEGKSIPRSAREFFSSYIVLPKNPCLVRTDYSGMHVLVLWKEERKEPVRPVPAPAPSKSDEDSSGVRFSISPPDDDFSFGDIMFSKVGRKLSKVESVKASPSGAWDKDTLDTVGEYADRFRQPDVRFSGGFGTSRRIGGARVKSAEENRLDSKLGEKRRTQTQEREKEKKSIRYNLKKIVRPEGKEFPDEPLHLDERTQAILSAIEGIRKQFGVDIDELETIIGYSFKLSHMTVTRSGRILLTDFGTEVKMDTLSRAVYILYLKHPEGIRFKALRDHRDELLQIYLSMSGRDNMKEIERSIDDLVNPFSNAINVKASRIKAAFKNAMSERIAKYYYIDGPSGTAKTIFLDREYVEWE